MHQHNFFLAIVVFVGILGASTAWFFGGDQRIARSNGREISQECLAKADAGDCEFYTCFDNRLPCGREGYARKYGHFYCNKINMIMETFSEDAQVFLEDSQRCLMDALKDIYREDSYECHDIGHVAVAAISRCFRDNAFCNALHGNFQQFFRIYEVNDLFSSGAGKVWLEIAKLARDCGGEALGSLAGSVRLQLENLHNRARNAFENAGEHVSNAVDTAQEHLSNFADNAGEAMENAAEDVSDALDNAADEVRSRLSDLFSWKKK